MIHNLPAFEHMDAQSVEHACTLLSENKETAGVIAGGTDLLVRMKYRAFTPKVLVNIKMLSNLSQINEASNGDLVIGSLVSLHEIENSSLIRERYPVLSQAAGKVANRVIRNMGTLGGNLCQDTRCEYYTHSHVFGREHWPKCFKRGGDLCHIMKKGDRCYARFSADMAPALLALGAKAKMVSPQGHRIIPLDNFYTGSGHPATILKYDEILTEIQIPTLYAGWKGVYIKLSYRETTDYPIVGVAALTHMDGNTCKEARLVATSVGSAPLRLKESENVVKGKHLEDSVITKAAEAATIAVNPVLHHGDSPKYVRQVLGACTKKALQEFLI